MYFYLFTEFDILNGALKDAVQRFPQYTMSQKSRSLTKILSTTSKCFHNGRVLS